jgi:hypothetical protein
VFNFEQTDDITAARQRGEMVLSILESPVLHAGLGMPDTSPDFKNSFGEPSWLSMEDAVEVKDSSTDLYICYAMPSRNVILESADVTGGSFDISMEKDINNTYIEANRNTFKSWVTFPTGGVPLYVTDKNADKLTIKAAQETGSRISQYDELSYIRAMHAWVYEGTFYTEDLTIQGQQPRVEGIEDIFFDYDSDNGLLTVYILARGNQKDSDFAKENVLGWPEDKGAQEISNSQYRLAVVRGSWRIRN